MTGAPKPRSLDFDILPPTMEDELLLRHQRISDLFLKASDLEPEERVAFLDRECSDDLELRKEVESLLAREADASQVLGHVAVDSDRIIGSPPTVHLGGTRPSLPPKIGSYRLLQKLGEGGMGEVWEAEQEEPVRRRVALKIIKWGMDTREVVARFESERQALALMDHPNVARVLDAGATEQGRPYFVMEYVHGVPITEHCDRHRLDTRERLELFMQVCDGVQHAHQNAIIHRDIKPSNVLVSFKDEKAVPKIIDFGVAKATAQRLTERTLFTELGQMIGTPEYMSPEQAEMTCQDVDTRTDVYSLGVLLYQLLVGVLPFDSHELREAGFDELRRRIREEEPPKPSSRLTTLGGESSSKEAKRRRTDSVTLRRQLRGDLDWVVMKALEKERIRRYRSPHDLASDIRRHLTQQPVEAGPPSAVYRARKFVARNKLPVGFAAVLALLLVGFAVTMTVQARRVAQERDRANQEAAAAAQVSEFLVGLFRVSDPGEARGNTITAREILDEGAEKIESELRDQPLVQARLMSTIGKVYQSLGLYKQAGPLLEDALELRREYRGEEDEDTVTSLLELAWNRSSQGNLAEAVPLCREAVAVSEGLSPKQLAGSLRFLAAMLRNTGNYEEARPLFERALAISEEIWGPDHVEVAWTVYHFAWQLNLTGEYGEAKLYYERALAIYERELGPDHPYALACLNDLAVVLQTTGDHEGAKSLYENALMKLETVLGPDHPAVADTLNNLGGLLWEMSAYEEAKGYHERALTIREQALGGDHPAVAGSLENLGLALRALDDDEAALALLERSLEIKEKALGGDHPSVAQSLNNLGLLLRKLGDYDGAERDLKRALAIQERALGPSHPEVASTLNYLGGLYNTVHDYETAQPLFERALAIWESVFGPDDIRVATALNNLGWLHYAKGNLEEARSLLERTVSIREEALESHDPRLALNRDVLGVVHHRLGACDTALPLFKRASIVPVDQLLISHHVGAYQDIAESLQRCAEGLQESGRGGEARDLLVRANAIGTKISDEQVATRRQ